MATITVSGETLGCAIGLGSFTEIGSAFTKARESTGELVKALGSLKTKINLAGIDTNLESSKESVKTAKECEKTKESALSNAYDKLTEFIADVGKVDSKVARKITERKEDFYARYDYLKPEYEIQKEEAEKGFFERIGDACADIRDWAVDTFNNACTWVKEHWKEILTVAAAVVVVAACVVLSVVTGGLASAIFAGIALGVGGQLVNDLATSVITKEFTVSSWQEYVGAGVGGGVTGTLNFFGLGALSDIIGSGISTVVGQTLSNVTGGEKRTAGQIIGNTIFNMGLSTILSAGDKGLTKLANNIGNKYNITFLRRLGDEFGSYNYAFETQMKKLRNGFTKNISWKTVRNGAMWFIQGLSIPENVFNGVLNKYDINEPQKLLNRIKESMTISPIKIDINIQFNLNINIGQTMGIVI